MTIRRLGTALVLTTLCIACAQGEMIPGDSNTIIGNPTAGTTSATGGKSGGNETTPSTSGGVTSTSPASAIPGGGSGGNTAAPSGGSAGSPTTTPAAGGSGTTATTATKPASAWGCGESTEELAMKFTPKANSYGGTITISAASGKTVPAATLLLKHCFALVGSTTPKFDDATLKANISIYNANASGLPNPLNYINMSQSIKYSGETVDAANKKYCIVYDFSGATDIDKVQLTNADAGAGGAGGGSQQIPTITLDWDMKSDILGTGNMMDVRPEGAAKFVAMNGTATAVCTSAE